MAYKRIKLSGSTDGRGIKVAATSSAGTTIHTAQSGTSFVDIVTLYAFNSTTTALTLTLEWGGTSAPDDNIVVDIPPQSGLFPVAIDLVLQNSLVIRAFAQTTNLITIHGYVNRES